MSKILEICIFVVNILLSFMLILVYIGSGPAVQFVMIVTALTCASWAVYVFMSNRNTADKLQSKANGTNQTQLHNNASDKEQ